MQTSIIIFFSHQGHIGCQTFPGQGFIVLMSMVFDLTLKIISDIAWFLFSFIYLLFYLKKFKWVTNIGSAYINGEQLINQFIPKVLIKYFTLLNSLLEPWKQQVLEDDQPHASLFFLLLCFNLSLEFSAISNCLSVSFPYISSYSNVNP